MVALSKSVAFVFVVVIRVEYFMRILQAWATSSLFPFSSEQFGISDDCADLEGDDEFFSSFYTIQNRWRSTRIPSQSSTNCRKLMAIYWMADLFEPSYYIIIFKSKY